MNILSRRHEPIDYLEISSELQVLISDSSDTSGVPSSKLHSNCTVLSLIKLYEHTKNTQFLTTAIEGVSVILDNIDKACRDNYGFEAGKMGAVFALLKINQITGNAAYLDKALQTAHDCTDVFLDSPYTDNSFCNGRSGTIHILLHLYHASRQKWVLECLERFVKKMLSELYHSSSGLRSESQHYYFNIKSPCGFATGNAGITYVLLELAQYFQNPAFNYVAEQLLRYIDHSWNEEMGNWPNFRMRPEHGKDHDLFKENYRTQGDKFFLTPSDDTSLRDGAAGIGLVYLKAYEILQNDHYKLQADRAINLIRNKAEEKFTNELTIPMRSIAEYERLASEAHSTLDRKDFAEWIVNIARKEIEHERTEKKEKLTLGTLDEKGYELLLLSLLKFHIPNRLPPLANTPVLERSKFKSIFIDESEIRKTLLTTIFPYTSFLLKVKYPHKLDHYASDLNTRAGGNDLHSFIDYVKQLLRKEQDEMLAEALMLEQTRLEITERIKSNSLVYIREVIYQENLEKIFFLDDDLFLDQQLRISKDLVFLKTKYDWTKINGIHKIPNDESKGRFDDLHQTGDHTIVIQPVSTFFVNELCLYENAFILEQFVEPATIRSAKENLMFFCRNQNVSFFAAFMGPNIELNEDFFKSLDATILKTVCGYLNLGILQPTMPVDRKL